MARVFSGNMVDRSEKWISLVFWKVRVTFGEFISRSYSFCPIIDMRYLASLA